MIRTSKKTLQLFFVFLSGCAMTSSQPPVRYLDVPPPPLVIDYVTVKDGVDYNGLMAYVDALELYQSVISEHRNTLLRKYFKHPAPKPEQETCVKLYYRDTLKLESPPDIDGLDPDQTIDALTTYIEQFHSQVREYNARISRTNEIQSIICDK